MPLAASQVLGKLLGSGLGRVGSVLFQKLVRLRKLDAAIRAGRFTSSPIHTALDDLQIVFGSYYGVLDEPLSNFLSELEKAGLATALSEQSLLQKESAATKAAFFELHERVIGRHGDPEALYGKLKVALTTALDNLSKDPALSLYLATFSRELIARLDKIEQTLQVEKDEAFDFPKTKSSLLKVSKGLQSEYRNVRIETNRGAKLVEISRIFITSKLQHKKIPENLTQELLKLQFEPGTRNIRVRPPEHLSRINYSEFEPSFRRAVVLGDPGGGKSTLCQYLCYQLAKQSSFGLQYGDTQEISPDSQKIPLRIVLRSFERARLAAPQLTIFDYIVGELKNVASIPHDELVQLVSYLLQFGRAVLAFDGLDEILNIARRREFVQLVANFCDQHPLCPVLVTSRVVGYQDAPLPSDFEELTLERFDEPEIYAYVTKFFRVVANAKKADAELKAREFMRQTDKTASDLRQNPLLLGLMAYLFEGKGDVPSNRPEIYKECAILMFEKWDQNRNIRAEIPSDFDLLHLFSRVAAKIFGNPELEEGVSADWLQKTIRNYFTEQYESGSKAIEAAKSVTAFLTGRAWIMSEFGPDVYRFTHRTFLEYFLARNLDEEYETVAELWPILKEHILRSEWDVISHLALQLKTFRNQRRISQALQEIFNFLNTKLNGKQKAAAILFSSRALEYLPGSEPQVKGLVQTICALAFETLKKKDTSPIEALAACCNGANDRRSFVSEVVSEFITEKIRLSPAPEADLALSLVPSRFPEFPIFPVTNELAVGAHVGDKVRAALRQHMISQAREDSHYARLYWEWYGDRFSDLYNTHRLAIFNISDRGLPPKPRFDSLTALVLSAGPVWPNHGIPGEAINMAQRVLATVGEQGVQSFPIQLSSVFTGPPPVVVPSTLWIAALNALRDRPAMLRGAVIAVLFLAELRTNSSSRPSSDPLSYFSGSGFQAELGSFLESKRYESVKSEIFDPWVNGTLRFVRRAQ